MLDLRFRRFWLAGAWLIVASLVVGSLLPGPVVETVNVWDKGEHALGYFALAGWCLGLVRPGRYLAVVLGAVAFGVGLEIAQGVLTTTRLMDPIDVLANAIGAAAAGLAARLGLGGWAALVERALMGPPGG